MPTSVGWLSLRRLAAGPVVSIEATAWGPGGSTATKTNGVDADGNLAHVIASAAQIEALEAEPIARAFLAEAPERSRRSLPPSLAGRVFLVATAVFLPLLVLAGIGVGIWLLVR